MNEINDKLYQQISFEQRTVRRKEPECIFYKSYLRVGH